MDSKQYLTFDLLLQGHAGGYRALVVDSPVGQDHNQFEQLFQAGQLDTLLQRISMNDANATQELGQGIFNAVLGSRLQSLLSRSLDEAERQEKGLRIRLRLSDAPELINLPWEYLYDPARQRYHALSVDTPVVRFLSLPERLGSVSADLPLKVLVMLSAPTNFQALDVEAEWDRLKQALGPLEDRGLLQVERIDQATLPVLQQRLRVNDYHVFHFIGHGAMDEETQSGALVFETDSGAGQLVSSRQLSALLYDEKTLRLVVLNACHGGQTWANNPFGGVAQGLVQQGIPAVVAMQFAVTDQAAIAFSQGFYSALADFSPIDAAVSEARKAMYFAGNAVEWGTPVLYLRAANAQIFTSAQAPIAVQTPHLEPVQPEIEPLEDAAAAAETTSPVPSPSQADFTPLGKWLLAYELDSYEELTVVFEPDDQFHGSLYYKRSSTWVEDDVSGKWSYDPVKRRLSLNGKFDQYPDRYSITPFIQSGDGNFFTAKDHQEVEYTLTKVTADFLPAGKWLVEYESEGPTELVVNFLPAGEFTAELSIKESKRWVTEAVDGQWAYDPSKKRLSLSGKFVNWSDRFSITPYIQQWQRDHFSAKDSKGTQYFLRRIG